ncbi:hypothetical protein JNW90_28605 [Micromonospora sp. STR1s_5]|nr:hypothetical protein [Micromonospora sp. STR1s_5]
MDPASDAGGARVMSEEVKLIWIVQRNPHTGKPIPNEGRAYDGKVSVAIVKGVDDGPGRGQWDWSMYAYGRGTIGHLDRPREDRGRCNTREEAKAAAEAAYRKLLSLHPGNRQAIRDHNAAVKEGARLWENGEGLRRAREAERSPE